MGKVKVSRISGVTDPLTGLPAKQIELVEIRDSRRPEMFPANDEARVVQGMISQLQSMGVMPQMREIGVSTSHDPVGVVPVNLSLQRRSRIGVSEVLFFAVF